MTRRNRFLVAFTLLALCVPLAAAQPQPPTGTTTVFRPEPIEGLVLTPLQNATTELARNATTHLSFSLLNNGSQELRLRLSAFEFAPPNAARLVDLRLNASNLTLAPGAEAILGVDATMSGEARNGTVRRAALQVAREGANGMQDALLTFRVPGACEGECPSENEGEGGFFFMGPGGGQGPAPGPGAGPMIVQRPIGEMAGNGSRNGSRASSSALDAPEEEVPGAGVVLACGALAAAAFVLRRRGA